MDVPTWKVLLALSGGLVVFAVFLNTLDLPLGPLGVAILFVLALGSAGLMYVTMRFGYRFGKRMGPDAEE